MEIKWTTFQPPREKPLILKMRVGITNVGRLSINYTAFRAMGQPEAVHLLFDPVNALVGLKPVYPTTPNAKILKRRRDRRLSFFVVVKDFCNFYGINYRNGIQFDRIEPQSDGTLVCYLDPSTKYFRRTDG